MEKFAFISRHKASAEQHALAAKCEIELIEIGDLDAFQVSSSQLDALGAFAGVVVVHPAAAMRLAHMFMVGVFKNENRAGIGERPQFMAKEFEIYDLRD